MASTSSTQATCQALLNFVTDGEFPDTDSLVSAEFPLEVIPTSLIGIAKVEEELKTEISTLGRDTAVNIDGWITQAKQLHQDIERSRLTAREIVALHEKGQELSGLVVTAKSSVERFQDDIDISNAVLEILEEVRLIDEKLADSRLSSNKRQWVRSINLLDEVEQCVAGSKFLQSSNIAGLLSTKLAELHAEIATSLKAEWNSMIKFDFALHELTIRINYSDNSPDALIGLSKMGLLENIVRTFQDDMIKYIFRPVICPLKSAPWRAFSVTKNHARLLQIPSKPSISDIISGTLSIFSFLQEQLPSAVIRTMLDTFAKTIVTHLLTKWLSPAIPSDVSSLEAFQKTIHQVREFIDSMKKQGWEGLDELALWIEHVPRLWLGQRRAAALNDVRVAMSNSSGHTRVVERIEKEFVSSDEDRFIEQKGDDDWNAEWSDNEDEPSESLKKGSFTEENEDESWDWDDEDPAGAAQPKEVIGDSSPAIANGNTQQAKREIVLTESYAITDLPDSILAIILNQVIDAENLVNLRTLQLKFASSRPALLALPTLVLGMFKATAPMFYSQKFNVNQICLYNDCMYLAERLRSLPETQHYPKLNSDIESLEKFGKAAYGKELHSQRTILTDLLDCCQGFSSCSEEPFLGECKNAMAATADRVSFIYNDWQPILSRSALLQSIGALVSAAVNKLILDIEDLTDISDAESRQLAEFCTSLSKLEKLFLPDPELDSNSRDDPDAIPMTAIYVPNWLKFQYLINILESSLADIKYLWAEGELRLEFEADELVDLIKALFADSDYRKRAIAEIRRAPCVP
ncbi:ribosome biogenesis protein ytm1 [Ophidiomyces ophidiicola]|nr:ribosome biogenesis protein ytm1 [Ophidiomyces ophidiicola]